MVAVLVLVAAYSVCFAQEEEKWVAPSKESQTYHEYRLKISRPPDGLEKVLAIITRIKNDDDENMAMPQKEYMTLTLREN